MRPLSAALTLVSVCAAFSSIARAQARTVSAACAVLGRERTRGESIRVDGVARSYLVHVPERGQERRLPIVLAFHGRGETPEQLAIVVYPRGVPGRGGKRSWSGTPTAAKGVDDVHFVRAIVTRLGASRCVDAGRIYATGKSDGGGLAAQLACKAADLITAAAPVAGAYYPIPGGCTPTRPVAILEFHGTDDRVVPYTGSKKRNLPDVHAWLAAWANRDRCTRKLPSRFVGPDVSRQVWSGCGGGGDVEGYRIEGGGHTWPGARSKSGPGRTTRAIDATALIATFFHLAP